MDIDIANDQDVLSAIAIVVFFGPPVPAHSASLHAADDRLEPDTSHAATPISSEDEDEDEEKDFNTLCLKMREQFSELESKDFSNDRAYRDLWRWLARDDKDSDRLDTTDDEDSD